MKILKPGLNLEPGKPKVFSCLECGCEFEADPEEYTTAFQYHTVSFTPHVPTAKTWFARIFPAPIRSFTRRICLMFDWFPDVIKEETSCELRYLPERPCYQRNSGS